MKIFIIESSPLVRIELIERISPMNGMKIVGTADNSEVAIISIEKLQPDVVIVDSEHCFGNEFRVCCRIREIDSGIRIIVFNNAFCDEKGCTDECVVKNHCFERADEKEDIIKILSA